MVTETKTKVVKTICGMCGIDCGMNVYVEDGRIVKVEGMPEHVVNHLCVKAEAIPELVYSPDRLLHPMRKVNGEWQRVTWDEALDIIVGKLEEHRKEIGPEALAVFLGQGITLGDNRWWGKRFCDAYSTPNYTSGNSHCAYARVIGGTLTTGHGLIMPSYRGSKCMVMWGSNPEQSSEVAMLAIDFTQAYGSKLIVVDPRKIPLAKRADIHAQLRPGTDSALALGLLNVIISEELYNKRFVEKYTHGFDELAEHVKKYPPEEVEKITWVPAETIREFARMYATTKPASILEGISLDHCTNGIQAIRAIDILIAITGNYDIPGGNNYVEKPNWDDMGILERVSAKPFDEKYPVFMKYMRNEIPASHLPETILTGKPYPIKAYFVQGGNPVTQFPNANKTIAALKKVDLLVVMDLFMTETAKLADIVLPACTFLEREELFAQYMGLPLASLRKKVIEPIGESWPDWKFWFELAKRTGHGEDFPWEDVTEAIDVHLAPTELTVKGLQEDDRGLFWGDKDMVKRYQFRGEGFSTPSGKVEIYADQLKEYGYDPLPTYHEPAESPISQPEMAKGYPFVLTTGSRIKFFTHSQHRNLPTLRKQHPDPFMEINTEDAAGLGINEDDMVIVESPRGRVKMKAHVTDDILPKVVHVQHGWSGEANANFLTDDMPLDPIDGFPGFKQALCRVRKA